MIQKYSAILIFGPPGVGKGTQAKLLGQSKKYFHFSTGDMFRNLHKGSEIGKRVHELISAGNFVPDELTIKLFYETIHNYEIERKFNPLEQTLILDGIPRNINQVELIKDRIDVKRIIYLVVNDEAELLKRLVKRAEIEGRHDDNEMVIMKRLRIYKKDTAEVLKQYAPDLILKINGAGIIEEINKEKINKLQ